MYHELHVLLSYVDDTDCPVSALDIPEHLADLFYPHSRTLPLEIAFRLLKAKGLMTEHKGKAYTITPKGKKAVQAYVAYIESEHRH